MANKALATASATTPSSTVTVSAGIVIAGNPITITSQDINEIAKNGFKFELANPVELGSIEDLLNWVKDTFFKNDTSFNPGDIVDTVKGLPVVGTTLGELLQAVFTVQSFKMNTKAKTFEVAILIKAPNDGMSFLNDLIVLKEVGIAVDYAGAQQEDSKTS